MREAEAAPSLSLSKRKEIFVALTRAMVHADEEAAKGAAPGSTAQLELSAKLHLEHRKKVLEKYGITAMQAEKIVEEGYAKSWRPSASGEIVTELD